MKFLRNKYIRNFILFFSIFSLVSFNYNVKKSEAFVSEAIMIGGGIAIAPEVATVLVGSALAYGGYKLYDAYSDSLKKAIVNKMSSIGISKFFGYVNDKNVDYATLNKDGIDYVQQQAEEFKKDNSYELPYNPVKVDNTKPSIEPFLYDDFTMYTSTISYLNYSGAELFTFKIPSGNSVTICIMLNLDTHRVFKYTPEIFNNDVYYKIVLNDTHQSCSLLYSYDCINWSKVNMFYGNPSLSLNGSSAISYGFTSEHAYIPSSSALTGGIEGNASDVLADGSVVALPLTSSVETNGQKVYTSDSTVTTVLTDTNTVPGTGENTGIITGVIEGINTIIETLTGYGTKIISAINAIPVSFANTIENIFSIDGDISLDFSPLQIATQKFPWCIPWDLYETIKIFNSDEMPLQYEFNEVKYSDTNIIIIPSFTVDFSTIPHINVLRSVFKFFVYISFIVFLINKVKGLIK